MFLSGSPLAALSTHPDTGGGPRHLAPRHPSLLIARHLQLRQPLHDDALKFSLDPCKADKTEGLNFKMITEASYIFYEAKNVCVKIII